MLGFYAIGEAALGEDLTGSAVAAAVGNITVDVVVSGTAAYSELITPTAAGAVPVDVTAGAAVAHGALGTAAVPLDVIAVGAVSHGVSAVGDGVVGVTVAAVATHLRYELRGEVRVSGVLVNRRVRAYSRQTGALVREGDTVAGRFVLQTGFSSAEFFTAAIDMSDDAVDWTPPVSNRVLSVLAQDV